MELIHVSGVHPGIAWEIPYATAENFMGEVLYSHPICFVHRDLVEPLRQVMAGLGPLRLKVWDGFRPIEVQKKMWDRIGDPAYVAPPENARHGRGTAVDLTLIDRDGRELPMPTLFDDLSERAHYSYQELTDEQKENRARLREAMEGAGFEALATEWWHFDLKGWGNYPMLSYGVKDLV